MVVDMDMVVTDMVDMAIAVKFTRIFFTAKRPNIQCSFPPLNIGLYHTTFL